MVFVWVFSKVSTQWYLRSPCGVFRHSLIARSPPHVAIVSPAFAQQTCQTLSLCPSRTAKTQDSVEDDDDTIMEIDLTDLFSVLDFESLESLISENADVEYLTSLADALSEAHAGA